MAAEWSEDAFQDRVKRRVIELGQSESALLRAAGVSEDLIRKRPGVARRMDSICAIARALDWTLAEAIGVQATPRVDIDLLTRAMVVAEQKIPRRIDERGSWVAKAAATFYDILADRRAQGTPIASDEEALALADALIRGMGLRPSA